MVGVPAAGEHRVQLLPGLLPRCEAVHRVGGDPLGRMDGGGIAETGRGAHIVKRACLDCPHALPCRQRAGRQPHPRWETPSEVALVSSLVSLRRVLVSLCDGEDV